MLYTRPFCPGKSVGPTVYIGYDAPPNRLRPGATLINHRARNGFSLHRYTRKNTHSNTIEKSGIGKGKFHSLNTIETIINSGIQMRNFRQRSDCYTVNCTRANHCNLVASIVGMKIINNLIVPVSSQTIEAGQQSHFYGKWYKLIQVLSKCCAAKK